MTIKEFMSEFIEFMNSYDCNVKEVALPNNMDSSYEIHDTLDTEFRITLTNYFPPDPWLVVVFSDIPAIGFSLRISNFTFIDAYIALLEMNLFKVCVRAMIVNQIVKFDLIDIIDEAVFSNNGNAVSKIFELVDNMRNDPEYKIDLVLDKSYMFDIKESDIDKLINKYPDSLKCIPVLLRYKNDHFKHEEEEIEL